MKIKSLGAVLAKRFGVKAAEDLAPEHPTLGDVNSPDELERYQVEARVQEVRQRCLRHLRRSGSASTRP